MNRGVDLEQDKNNEVCRVEEVHKDREVRREEVVRGDGEHRRKLTREAVLWETHYGVKIYAHVLRKYYQDDVVIVLRGNHCLPAKNPFNGDKETLQVDIVNGVARHHDKEMESFLGDAFDFAALHYGLEGEALLEKLNEEMGLRIGCGFGDCVSAREVVMGADMRKEVKRGDMRVVVRNGYEEQVGSDSDAGQVSRGNDQKFPHFTHFPQGGQIEVIRGPVCSFFKKPVRNTIPNGSMSLVEVYQRIKGAIYMRQTNALRTISDEKEARAYKAERFDYVTFSGTFAKRENSALIQHSGLFAVDFDHVEDVEVLKKLLLGDAYFETDLLFISPSGKGLKWIVPIDVTKASHQQYAIGIGNYLFQAYGQKMDASGKDVARACFLPHDPNIYINPKYLIQPQSA